MTFAESLRLAFDSLKANKLRAFLTMLGIIIGISSVITITTIGNSLQLTIAKTMRELGNTNIIYAFVSQDYPNFSTEEEWETYVFPEMQDDEKITYERLMEFQEVYSDRIESIGLTEQIGSGTVNTETGSAKVSVTGTTPNPLSTMKVDILYGRDVSAGDNEKQAPVAVVSDKFVRYAFDGMNPIGKQIEVESQDGTIIKLYVVGVYEYNATRMGDYNDPSTPEKDKVTPIYTSYTYAHEYIKSTSEYYEDSISNFQFYAKDGEDATLLASDAANYFNETYFNQRGNFYLETYDMASELSTIDNVLNILTIAIAVIAAISLVVGGVGVMNIMLVSVIERTREIGIRKALGAKNKSIRRQFLTEAVVICLTGGVIGILVGILLGIILGQVAGMLVSSSVTGLEGGLTISVAPNPTAIIISLIFSMAIGVIFGYYPAKRAANMSPIDALRYE